MKKGVLQAGVAREVITPPRGIFLVGYGDRSKGNQGVHDDLTATALVLQDGTKRTAIVACDLLCINEWIVDQIRARVAPIEVLICCSHTHSGPIGYADKNYGHKEQKYIAHLVDQICAAIFDADARMEPAQITWAKTEAWIGINRREKMPDGHMEIGENPKGVVDRSVQVVSVLTQKGKRLATLVNFACHGTVWGPDNLLVSADWIGAMRGEVEAGLGGMVLFLQGATGDINPQMGWGRTDTWQMTFAQGKLVAEAVEKAAHTRQKSLNSLPIDIKREEVWMPFDVKVEGSRVPKDYRKRLLSMAGLPNWMWIFTDLLLKTRYPWKPRIEARGENWGTWLRVNILRVGDLAVVTFGSETFTEIGIKLKKDSIAKVTLFASITDGCIGYLPTRKAYSEGGYEVETVPYAYRFPGRLAKGNDRKALQTVQKNLSMLFDR